MIVKQENKFITFIKKFWVYILAAFLVIAIGVTLGVVAALRENPSVIDVAGPNGDDENNQDPTGGNKDPSEEDKKDDDDDKPVEPEPETQTFGLPMNNASIIKDFNNTQIKYNPTLEIWEPHFYIDMTAEDLSVMAVLDGSVKSVEYDYLTGWVVTIEHSNGFVSIYGSLAENLNVEKGDKVKKGDKIGLASNIAAASTKFGNHLEFTLIKDNKKVDPNNYLDLQSK